MNWLAQNWGTLVIGAALLAVVTLIVIRAVKDRRAGKTVCGGDCAHCGCACSCGTAPQEKKKNS